MNILIVISTYFSSHYIRFMMTDSCIPFNTNFDLKDPGVKIEQSTHIASLTNEIYKEKLFSALCSIFTQAPVRLKGVLKITTQLHCAATTEYPHIGTSCQLDSGNKQSTLCHHNVRHIKRLLRAYIFDALMDYFWEFMVFLKSLILCQKSANQKKLGNFEPLYFE